MAVKRSVLCLNIPMPGMIENLNLGTASGIVLYEVTKQRREYQRVYKYKNKRGKNMSCKEILNGFIQQLPGSIYLIMF